MKVEINLYGFLLGRILRSALAKQQGKEQKVDGAAAGTNDLVKQVLLACQNRCMQSTWNPGFDAVIQQQKGLRRQRSRRDSFTKGIIEKL